MDVYFALRDVIRAPRARALPILAGLHCRQSHYLALILCLHLQAVLYGHLKQLKTSVNVAKVTEVLREKQVIRIMTASINGLLSQALAFIYVKIFIFLYLFLSDCFLDWGTESQSWILRIGSVLQFMMLYDLTTSGSKIVTICRGTATKFLKEGPQPANEENVVPWSQVYQILSFDELQDSLTVLNCFTFTKKSLFSSLAVVITCIGVLLQFDHRILAKLDADVRRYHKAGAR